MESGIDAAASGIYRCGQSFDVAFRRLARVDSGLGGCLRKRMFPETRDAVAPIRRPHAKWGEHVRAGDRVF
jgi:hypothetical protein